MNKRILSFDGATATALQVRLLEYYERDCPGFMAKTDVFAGTSDGALMGLYLAQHCNDDNANNLEAIKGARSFSDELIPMFQFGLGKMLKFASGWLPFCYSGDYEDLLARTYGQQPLADLDNKVIAVAFNVMQWMPYVFSNLGPPGGEDLPTGPTIPSSFDPGDVFPPEAPQSSVFDAAMASSAAPMALPLRRVNDKAISVDGGLTANNPTLLALARTCEWMANTKDARRVREQLPNLRVMSLGATESPRARRRIVQGFVPNCLAFRDLHWGWKQWLPLRPLLLMQMLFQGQVNTVDYECSRFLSPEQYLRVEPPMEQVKTMLELVFSPAQCLIKKLDEQAERLWNTPEFRTEVLRWLKNSWMVD